MPYGLDSQGRPIFLISTMAMHTQNLQADPRASLFVTEPDASGDALGSSRVTLIGSANRVPEPELPDVRTAYLTGYPDSKYWVDFEDFFFYRLDVIDVYYVGGFGVMGWVAASDYSQAQSDPLADDSRAQHFVAAEVQQGSLGIGSIFLPCEALREYFYRLLPAAQQPACHQQVLAGDLKGQAPGAGQVGRCHPAHGLVARAKVDPMKVAGEQKRGGKIAFCCYRPLISPDREGGKSVSHSKEWRGRRDSNPRPLP